MGEPLFCGAIVAAAYLGVAHGAPCRFESARYVLRRAPASCFPQVVA